jgi:hypothetical protein
MSSWHFEERAKMNYARHGHALTGISERYIMVTGSRKEVSNAGHKVELYDTENNHWIEC